MKISLFCGADVMTVGDAVSRVRDAASEGFNAVWFAQGFNLDAVTTIAIVGSLVPDIELGTSVVPIQGRHPLPLALAALTASDALGPNRMTLGVGVSHRVVSEGVFNIPYSESVERCRDELIVLDDLFSDARSAEYDGPTLSAHVKVGAQTPRPRLVLAALGPKMLALAGELTDGTVTWMTGPKTLEREVIPVLQSSSRRLGRPKPVVIAGLPICVTDDVAASKERIGAAMQGPATLPSYRRMLDAEGVEHPVEIALVGSESELDDRLAHLSSIGVDELIANIQGSQDDQMRTRSFLAQRSHKNKT